MAGPQRKCRTDSFHSERGSEHGEGVEVCEAAGRGRVRKALSASLGCWVVQRSGSGYGVWGGRAGCEAVWEQRPFEGVAQDRVEPFVPTWLWST